MAALLGQRRVVRHASLRGMALRCVGKASHPASALAITPEARSAGRCRAPQPRGLGPGCHNATRDFVGQLLVSFVQGLEPVLPAMKLNAQLVDVAVDLGALRFIFPQMAPQLRQSFLNRPRRQVPGSMGLRRMGHRGGPSATLTSQSQSRSCAIHHQWRGATLAGKKNVALPVCRSFCRGAGLHQARN